MSIEEKVAKSMSERNGGRLKYLPIQNFPGYLIGEDGSIWTLWKARDGGHDLCEIPRKRKLKMPDMSHRIKRYPSVGLGLNGKTVWRMVHLLVIETFKGPRPCGMECRHLNGDRFDFKISNLKWGTKLENQKDKERHGTCQFGSKNGRSIMDECSVLKLRERRKYGDSYKSLAKAFGLSISGVNKIVNNVLWKRI